MTTHGPALLTSSALVIVLFLIIFVKVRHSKLFCWYVALQSVSAGLSLFSQTVASSLTGSKTSIGGKKDVTVSDKTRDYRPGVVTVLDVQRVKVSQQSAADVSAKMFLRYSYVLQYTVHIIARICILEDFTCTTAL